MSERIDWTSDESVVRAILPDAYEDESGWITDARGERKYGMGWENARKHLSVAALDEAHRKVMEKWPDAQVVQRRDAKGGWTIFRRPEWHFDDGSGPIEAECWIAASKLEGPSVQGEPTPNLEEFPLMVELPKESGPVSANFGNHIREGVAIVKEMFAAPREEEGAGGAECLCDEYGTDLCSIHRTHCKECGKPLAAPVVEEAVGEDHGDPSTWSDENFVLRGGVEEAPRVVTWRVDWVHASGNVMRFHADDESEARKRFSGKHSPKETIRLVKVTIVINGNTTTTTTEEVIEVRTKESADGK